MNQVPAHLLARPSRNLAQSAIRGLGGNNPAHISIRKNRFTLVDAAGNEKPIEAFSLDVIIVDVNDAPGPSKIYFAGEFNPESRDPPACFSDNGIGPSSQSSQPQSPTCAICPHNAWGSDTSRLTGRPTKACNDVKKVAVMVAGYDMPFLLRIPPASLKIFKAYALMVGSHAIPGANRNYDLSDIITKLSFDDLAQGVLNFTMVGLADEAQCATMEKWWGDKRTDILIGRGDIPVDKDKVSLGAPAQPRAIEAPKPQMAPPPNPSAMGQQATAAQSFELPGASQEAKPRGRPRTRTAPATPPTHPLAGEGTAGESLDIPPFLQRSPAAAPKPATPSFGMTEPVEPDAALRAAVAEAFKLPT